MDIDLRLKALSVLATSSSKEAFEALKAVLQKALRSLRDDNRYESLEQSLEELEVIGFRFSDEVAVDTVAFAASVADRQLTYEDDLAAHAAFNAKYRSTPMLITKAIDVLLPLRYLSTAVVAQALLDFSLHEDERVRAHARDGLVALTSYDSRIFYGTDDEQGIAGYPQKKMLDVVVGLEDERLLTYFNAVLSIAGNLLSPTVEGRQWKSNSLTISRGSVPAAGGVPEVRSDTIQLLKRLYSLVDNVEQRMAIIGVLNEATRSNYGYGGDTNVVAMLIQNRIEILDYFKRIVETAEFQIVQKIEGLAYWNYFHAPSEEVKSAALAIESSIATNYEYQVYKTLIGFEGIFVSWEQLRKQDGYWEETDKFRRSKALEFVQSISAENFPLWRERIRSYAETESNDLATFPVFYYFLEELAKTQSALALELLSEDSEHLSKFLIPLLRGLWNGPARPRLESVLNTWIDEGRHLYAIAKQFINCPTLSLELVERLLARAVELGDFSTVAMILQVAATNVEEGESSVISKLFIPALKSLTKVKDANWILEAWFSRETRLILSKLSDTEIDLVLENLSYLDRIDYQAEEILSLIAKRSPQKILDLLFRRLSSEARDGISSDDYQAIPFRLHKLDKPLAEDASMTMRIARSHYDGDYGTFVWHGARLIMTIFPQFPPEFETELLRFVDEGDERDLEFVMAVLRNYDGQPFVQGVCKAIIRKIPFESEWRSEVYVALQNTGVVTGEYGFAEAYERKKAEIEEWLHDANERVRVFAAWYIEGLDQMIDADRKRADEGIALRKHRFNE